MSDQDSNKPALDAVAKNLDFVDLIDDSSDGNNIKNNKSSSIQPKKRMRRGKSTRQSPRTLTPTSTQRSIPPPPTGRAQVGSLYLTNQSVAGQLGEERQAYKAQEPQTQHQQQQGAKRKREDWADFEAFEASDSDDQRSGQPQGQEQERLNQPWMRHEYSHQSSAIEMFTQEITDYADYLKPTLEEHAIRTYVFKAVEEFVTRLWSEAKVHVFGSFNTQLYLPGSDMDIVIMLDKGKPGPGLLRTLAKKIRSSGFGINVEAIIFAKVPIVKFQERRTGIHVDISLNQLDGFKTGVTVQQFMAQMPALRPMTMLIKQFLKSKPANFSDVHQGGLGSFSVTLMVMSFLQMHPLIQSRRIDPILNLGVLVIEFFELYGLCFNYSNVSISVTRGGSYIQKGGDGLQNERLTLINPIANRDVAKGTRNMPIIRAAFVLAYQELTSTIRNRQEELNRKPRPTRAQPGSSLTSETLLRQRSMIKKVFRLPSHVEKNRGDIRAIFEEGVFQARFGELVREQGQGLDLEDMPLVGDENPLHKVNEDDGLIRAYRRHFPRKSDLTTIKDFATSFKPKLVRRATTMEPLGPLLSETEYESLIVKINELSAAISRARAGFAKKQPVNSSHPGLESGTETDDTVKPVEAKTVKKWRTLIAELKEPIKKDRLRTVALVLQEAAQPEQHETSTMQREAVVVTQQDDDSLESQASRLQVISQRVVELFDTLDPSDSSQLAAFHPQCTELMEQQAQFGVRQVEHQEGIVLSPEDREQLVEWSNSAVIDRLRSMNPIKMTKVEEALLMMNSRSEDNQGQDQDLATPTATGVSSGSSGSNAALDFHRAHDLDEDNDLFEMDMSDVDEDEPSDKYFDAMMREAQMEYGSSEDNEDQDNESSSSSSVRAHRDPQNIRSGNDSIQLSQLYSSPKGDYGVGVSVKSGNSSRHEQLEKMRQRS